MQRKGLVVGSFRGWRYRLQRAAAPEFVQVTFDEPRATTVATLPNGVRIEFGANTDPTYIGAEKLSGTSWSTFHEHDWIASDAVQ